jgi:tol-pal system protein YbgF
VSHRVRRLLAIAWVPVVALTAGACLATQGNVRTLQAGIDTVRAQAAKADSLHRSQLAQLSQVAQQVAREVGSVSDSLRNLNAFLQRFSADVSRFQGDVSLSMHSFGQQLIALQERAGVSQKKLQDLAADLENSRSAAAAAPPLSQQVVAGATGSNPASGDPGPTALIQLAFGQLTKGSATTARAGFRDFLEKYPTNDLASEAWYGIGQTFDFESNQAAADSAYQVVVDSFPKSDRAPLALYKWAMNLRGAGQTARTRALLQQIVDKYPRSSEADMARDFLKAPE